MIYHATVVLSLCLGLFTLWTPTALAQSKKPAQPVDNSDPLADEGGEPSLPGSDAADEEPPYPAPEQDEGTSGTPAAGESATAQLNAQANSKTPAEASANDKADKERCAQLLAQGQAALAQAEGCGGGDQSIWAGSIVSFSQTTAPAYHTLPDNDNGFYALGLFIAPRLTLSERWALTADVSLAYEVTQPDDVNTGTQVQWGDARLTANGNLGTIGGLTFAGGPRLIVPTSKASWTMDTYAGTGAVLNIIKSIDVLEGLSLIAGGGYTHVWSGRLTPKIREDNAPKCQGTGSTDALSTCPAGDGRGIQDSLRAVGVATLNFSPAVSTQLSYVYGWSLVKPFKEQDVTVPTSTGPAEVTDNVIDDTRWRRFGSLTASVSYQPSSWFIASLQGNTSVCYGSSSGGQSALLGGCSGGLTTSSQALRNPIANKFSTIALQFTIPLDALYDAVKSNSGESKSARLARANKL